MHLLSHLPPPQRSYKNNHPRNRDNSVFAQKIVIRNNCVQFFFQKKAEEGTTIKNIHYFYKWRAFFDGIKCKP